MSRFTLVTVNYNAGYWLLRCLSAALRLSDAKTIVVDNASSDKSVVDAKAELAANESLATAAQERIQWIVNSTNLGFAAANNIALESIDTEFAVLINPDCELSEGCLEKIANAFDIHQELALASCRIINSDGSTQATYKRKFPTPASAFGRVTGLGKWLPKGSTMADFDLGHETVDENFSFVEAISGAFMVVRMSALKKVGLLDEAYFMHCEDLDWCMRFHLAGFKVGVVEDATVIHEKGVSSASRPVAVLYTLHKGMDRFFGKYYANDMGLFSRLVVRLGIAASFVSRAIASIASGLMPAKK